METAAKGQTMKRQTIKHAACTHPPQRLYSWFATNDQPPCLKDVLVIACCDCGKVLQGGC